MNIFFRKKRHFVRDVADFLPPGGEEYFDGLNSQHFGSDSVGSCFTEVDNIQKLLELCLEQRGSLDGDDREFFISKGAPESAFLAVEKVRYLKVLTAGKMGVKNVKNFRDDDLTKVVVVPGKETSSLVFEVESLADYVDVDYGVILVGKNILNVKDSSHKEMVWTAHPGYPTPLLLTNRWVSGEMVSISEVKKELGEDFYVSLRVRD